MVKSNSEDVSFLQTAVNLLENKTMKVPDKLASLQEQALDLTFRAEQLENWKDELSSKIEAIFDKNR